MRSNVPHSEGPSLTDLANSGIKINTLQKLMPKDSLKQLIPYDQVVVRGEDLSGLIFAQFPMKAAGQKDRVGNSSPTDDSKSEGQESKDSVPVRLAVQTVA